MKRQKNYIAHELYKCAGTSYCTFSEVHLYTINPISQHQPPIKMDTPRMVTAILLPSTSAVLVAEAKANEMSIIFQMTHLGTHKTLQKRNQLISLNERTPWPVLNTAVATFR